MPLTSAQIISLAVQAARVPGFTSQAGQILNKTLSDLCQTYDFDTTKQTFQFNFNASQINSNGQFYQNLPSNYLRGIKNESFYIIDGVPYPMIPVDLEEFDMLVQQAGLANFPVFYATDMSLSGVVNSPTGSGGAAVPVLLAWQVPSGAYPVTIRYYSQMPDITTPETSTAIPWFPNQTYLITEITGRLMQLSDDERTDAMLSDDQDRHPQGSGVILRKYLQMKDDKGTRVKTVQLDRRRFGTSFDRLRNTKTIGWTIAFLIAAAALFINRPADAQQQSKASLVSEVNVNWPDNTTGAITPALLRSTVIDIINSYTDLFGSFNTITYTSSYITTVVSANGLENFSKVSTNSTVDNVVGSASSNFTCSVNPVVNFIECGSSAACTSRVTIASITITGPNIAIPATVITPTITAGDFTAWNVVPGTCTQLNVRGAAQIHPTAR